MPICNLSPVPYNAAPSTMASGLCVLASLREIEIPPPLPPSLPPTFTFNS